MTFDPLPHAPLAMPKQVLERKGWLRDAIARLVRMPLFVQRREG